MMNISAQRAAIQYLCLNEPPVSALPRAASAAVTAFWAPTGLFFGWFFAEDFRRVRVSVPPIT
jgi:hypothetical protein